MRENNESKVSGVVLKKNGQLFIEVEKKYIPKFTSNNQFRIINRTEDMVIIGEAVKGKLVLLNKAACTYVCHIEQNNEAKIDIKTFSDLVTLTVLDRVNKEDIMYGEYKGTITIDDLTSRTKQRDISFCRQLCMYYTLEYLSNQRSPTEIGNIYGRDRATVLYAKKAVNNLYKVDSQIKCVMDDIEQELKTIYNNIKTN